MQLAKNWKIFWLFCKPLQKIKLQDNKFVPIPNRQRMAYMYWEDNEIHKSANGSFNVSNLLIAINGWGPCEQSSSH